MKTRRSTSAEDILYLGYLIPITLFFFLNPLQADIRNYKPLLGYFWIIYISFACGFLLCLKFYSIGPHPRWSMLLTMLGSLTVMLLICTFTFNTIPEQATLKLMAQLLLVCLVSIASYIIGTQFTFSRRVLIITTLIACITAAYGIISLRGSGFFFYLRPYGWSNYMLLFYVFWIAQIDTATPKVLRYAGILLLMSLIILSGTRTMLIWMLFGFLAAKPKQMVLSGVVLGLLGGIVAYIYLNFIHSEGADALLERYQLLLSDNRSPLWLAAIDRIKEQNMIFGGGYFAYPLLPSINGYITSAHNTYLHLLLIGGGLGLLIGMGMLSYVIYKNWRIAPGVVLFLPIVGMIGELPLYPYTYSRIFENSFMYFLIGLLVAWQRYKSSSELNKTNRLATTALLRSNNHGG